MINHSCIGNTHRAFLGDMTVVRASRDIANGTEIFLPYRLPDQFDVQALHDTIQKQWGFDCRCSICVSHLDPAGNPSKRVQVLREVKASTEATTLTQTKPATTAEIQQGESLFQKVEQSYDFPIFSPGVSRIGYLTIGLWLIRAYATNNSPRKMSKIGEKVSHALGYVMKGSGRTASIDRTNGFCHPELAELVAYMANAKEFFGGPSAKVLMDFARETWLLVHGDTEGFEKRYGSGS